MPERRLQQGDIFEVHLPMRWADADMMQHLNNATYFRFMEEARVMLMDQAGVRQGLDHGFVVVHCSCDFKQAITYPALVRVRLIAERLGRTSFDHRVEMSVVGDEQGQLRATGRAVMVSVDKRSGQSCAWPDDVLLQLGAVMHPDGQSGTLVSG